MNHIALLLPHDGLLYQAKALQKENPLIGDVRELRTASVLSETQRAISEGAAIIVARGLQALLIKEAYTIPVVALRLSAQELGLLLLKAHRITGLERPKVAIVAADNMLGNTRYSNLLFSVDLRVFYYSSEAEYTDAIKKAIKTSPDIMIGGNRCLTAAAAAGIPSLYLAHTDEALQIAIRNAETALYAHRQVSRLNSLSAAFLNTTTDAYIQFDEAGQIILVNDVMLRYLAIPKAEVLGQTLDKVWPELESLQIKNVLSEGHNASTYLGNPKHSDSPLLFLAVPLLDESRNIRGAVLSAHAVLPTASSTAVDSTALSARSGKPSLNPFKQIPAQSTEMLRCINSAQRLSQSGRPLLITGEFGVETDEIARAIHRNSQNASGTYHTFHLTANHTTASDTMAAEPTQWQQLSQVIKSIKKGSLYISAFEKLHPQSQYKLYRLSLDQNAIRFLFSLSPGLRLDQCRRRLIVEWFYSLESMQLHIPPFRERPEDCLNLITEQFENCLKRYNRFHILTNGAKGALLTLPWEGNRCEINIFVERLILETTQRTIDENAVNSLWLKLSPKHVIPQPDTKTDEIRTRFSSEEEEKLFLALQANHWNRQLTSEALDISPTTLWRKMKKYNIRKPSGKTRYS